MSISEVIEIILSTKTIVNTIIFKFYGKFEIENGDDLKTLEFLCDNFT